MKNKYIVVTGGGTGGHVFPALAIASELKRRGYSVLYIGSERGMENRLAPEQNIPLRVIRSGAVKNQGLLKTLKSLFAVGMAILRCMGWFIKSRPTAVVGVGGYVSVPACFAAWLLRIPLFLQEQNVSVGIANRFLGKLSCRIYLGFEQAKKYFSEKKCLVTGNPIRAEVEAVGTRPATNQTPRILVLGGSQGAKAINDLMIKLHDELFAKIEVVHQTGEKEKLRVESEYQKKGITGVSVTAFIKDMAEAYSQSTLVISRSGALTVSELVAAGRPAIFIPYPRQGQNDQTANAYFLEEKGVARVVEQGEGFEERFRKAFRMIYTADSLSQANQRFALLRTPHALTKLCDDLLNRL